MNPNDATDSGFSYPPQSADPHQWVKKLIGNYNVLEVIGQGNMAVLYKVEHCDLHKSYALKVLRMASNETDMERFLQEGRILAQLEHPNIVKVYQMSRAGNMPYLVLELIDGQDVAALLKGGLLEADKALEYTRQIAAALHYIHEQQIIHRDIKPTNIMITRQGVAKLTDFGIAKFLKKPLNLTRTGYTMGSVLYMSPEQLNQAQAPDWRTDIYSLGASLFCMLTGQPPFPGVSHFQIMQDIIAKESPSVRGKVKHKQVARLDALLYKMLAKKTEDRFQRAEDIIAEIESIQTGMSPDDLSLELASDLFNLKPEGLWRYSVQTEQGKCDLDIGSGKILRATLNEQKGDAALEALFEAISSRHIKSRCKIEGISSFRELEEICRVSIVNAAQIQQRLLNIWKEIDESKRSSCAGAADIYHTELSPEPQQVVAPDGTLLLALPEILPDKQESDARLALTSLLELPEDMSMPAHKAGDTPTMFPVVAGSQEQTHGDNVPTEPWPHAIKLATQSGHVESLRFATICSAVQMLVTVDKNYVIKYWHLASGRLISSQMLPYSSLNPNFTSNGRLATVVQKDRVNLYNTQKCESILELPIEFGMVPLTSALFSHDSQLLAFATQKGIHIWDFVAGRLLHYIDEEEIVISLCFNADSTLLASGNTSGVVQLWQVASGQRLLRFTGQENYIISLHFSRDSKWLAAGSNDGSIKLWQLKDGTCHKLLHGHSDYVNTLSFSEDSKLLASGSSDGTVKLWRLSDGQLLQTVAMSGRVILVDIADNGTTLLAVNSDGQVAVYDIGGDIASKGKWELCSAAVNTIRFSPDNQMLACGMDKGMVQVWDLVAGKPGNTLQTSGKIACLCFHKNGKELVWGTSEGALQSWNGECISDIEKHSSDIYDITFSEDGLTLISGNTKGQLVYTDMQQRSSKILPTAKGCLALSLARGKPLAALCVENKVIIYDIAGKPITQKISFPTHPFGLVIHLAGNGQYLAFCSDLNKLAIFELASGVNLKNFEIASRCFQFSQDGRRFAFATNEPAIHIWDVENRKNVAICQGVMPGVVHSLDFSSDNILLASASGGAIQLWEAATGNLLATLFNFAQNEWAVVSPDSCFDCSPGAEQYLHFVSGTAFHPYEQFAENYRRLGLLSNILVKTIAKDWRF
jgi:serine/threonine protein kinase/WD40 repeat protein